MVRSLTGPLAALALVLVPAAQAAQFTPLTDPENAVLQAVGRQIGMQVGAPFWIPKAYVSEVVFTNSGPLASSIDGIFFDDTRSGILHSISVFSQIGEVAFAERHPPDSLPGGEALSPPFVTSYQVRAVPPLPANGLDNSTGPDVGEVLFLWATVDPYRRDELFSALSGNKGTPLRIGVHVSSIAGYEGGSATFLFNNLSAIPEPASWGMLAAGLGVMGAWARRRRAADAPA